MEWTETIRVLQFNTLALMNSDTTWFPYAVSKEVEPEDRGVLVLPNGTPVVDHSPNRDHPHIGMPALSARGECYFALEHETGEFGVQHLEETSGAKRVLLSWEERLELLHKQLRELDADLNFLEEVDVRSVPHLVAIFGDEFSHIFECRPNSTEGCLIAWRKSKMEPAAPHAVLQFSDNKGKIALFQQFRFVEAPPSHHKCAQFIACGVHLFWNSLAKEHMQEARELGESLRSLAHLTQIVGGDFNCGMDCKSMTEGLRVQTARHTEHRQRTAVGDDTHRLFEVHEYCGSPLAFTTHVTRSPAPKLPNACHANDPTYTTNNPCAVDHILISLAPHCQLSRAVCVDTIPGFVPSPTNGLPSKQAGIGSDHIPIAADLEFVFSNDFQP